METGGGIYQALPYLGDAPFLVISSDVWTNFPWRQLVFLPLQPGQVHLVLVPKPQWAPRGDFTLNANGLLSLEAHNALTYSGIACCHPAAWQSFSSGRYPFRDVMIQAMQAGLLTGQVWQGAWFNVGDALQLKYLSDYLADCRVS